MSGESTEDALAAAVGAILAQDFDVAADRMTSLLADADPGTGARLREQARLFEAAARRLAGCGPGGSAPSHGSIGSATPDPGGLPPAQAALVRAYQHLVAGQRPEALADLEVAERAARRAEDASAYAAARLATARLHEEADERESAYLALATGWATLRAALGPEAARQTFEPAMAELLQRWGPEEFERVRSTASAG